jgi:hypothetical protein
MWFRYLPVIAILFLTACASPADMNSMVVSKPPAERINLPTTVQKAFSVARVSGGEETNPLWTSQVDAVSFQGALERSLESSGLLGGGNTAKHSIEATLRNLDQPLIGLDMTVTSTVNYTIRDMGSKTVWFDENISASYTATFSDAFVALTRLKLANEGSIRENITAFIDDLIKKTPQ